MAHKLVAVLFEGEYTAAGVLDTLRQLERSGALSITDAVVVSRSVVGEHLVLQPSWAGASATAPVIVPSSNLTVDQTTYGRGKAAAKGAGVGVIVGWLLGGPIGGLAAGALAGALIDRGIKDSFVDDVAQQLHSNSSALLILAASADPSAVLEAIRPYKGRVLTTELSPETEQSLREALEREE